jgi:hypothetical protein
VIRVYDDAGNVIEENKSLSGFFTEALDFFLALSAFLL